MAATIVIKRFQLMSRGEVRAGKFVQSDALAGMIEWIRHALNAGTYRVQAVLQFGSQFCDALIGALCQSALGARVNRAHERSRFASKFLQGNKNFAQTSEHQTELIGFLLNRPDFGDSCCYIPITQKLESAAKSDLSVLFECH